MQLLVIKSGGTYLRIKEEDEFWVGLDKASVFPMNRLSRVKDLLTRLLQKGQSDAAIYRLTLTETPLEEE